MLQLYDAEKGVKHNIAYFYGQKLRLKHYLIFRQQFMIYNLTLILRFFMPLPIEFRSYKKTHYRPTNRLMDGRTDGRRDPHIEMRGHI